MPHNVQIPVTHYLANDLKAYRICGNADQLGSDKWCYDCWKVGESIQSKVHFIRFSIRGE